jgi:hypothetical protein
MKAKGKCWLGDQGTKARVKKRVLAPSRGTNHATTSHVLWRIKALSLPQNQISLEAKLKPLRNKLFPWLC